MPQNKVKQNNSSYIWTGSHEILTWNIQHEHGINGIFYLITLYVQVSKKCEIFRMRNCQSKRKSESLALK